ncbi:MAG: hypothetical protein QOK37_3354 [Thermoanaerobaculia bacterium]|jgi:hypothetical protein|nr:hypothetical protein [Thermoanaerobaculia bacterium]
MRRLIFFASLALFAASSAVAQQCTSSDTTVTCFRKYNPLAAATAQSVATTNTGTPTATTLATATALRDFLSFFSAGVDAGTVIENGTSVTLDWNFPFPFVEDNDKVKVQSVFNDPSLAADIQTPLGSNATNAKSTLTNFDDISTLISYDPVNQRLGRSIAPHIKLFEALNPTAASLFAVFAQTLFTNKAALPQNFDQNTPFSAITDATLQQTIITQLETAAAAQKNAVAVSASLTKALTQLLNNQPQAYVGGIYHYRNELVGPDEFSVKGTFEVSPKSLNRFLKNNADVCSKAVTGIADANATTCANRMVSFAAVDDPSAQPSASDRLAFAIEYTQTKSESVDLTKFSVVPPNTPVLRPGTHSITYSLTYGHPITSAKIKDARVDVAVNYDNVSNDPTMKDRFVASLTFSQKISDTMTLPISITYANHTQYLPQTDRRMGVHFGISYKIPNNSGQ